MREWWGGHIYIYIYAWGPVYPGPGAGFSRVPGIAGKPFGAAATLRVDEASQTLPGLDFERLRADLNSVVDAKPQKTLLVAGL